MLLKVADVYMKADDVGPKAADVGPKAADVFAESRLSYLDKWYRTTNENKF